MLAQGPFYSLCLKFFLRSPTATLKAPCLLLVWYLCLTGHRMHRHASTSEIPRERGAGYWDRRPRADPNVFSSSPRMSGRSVRAQIYIRLVPTSRPPPFLAVKSQCQYRIKADLMGREEIRNIALPSPFLCLAHNSLSSPGPQVYLVTHYPSCSLEGPSSFLASSALHGSKPSGWLAAQSHRAHSLTGWG